MLGSLGEFSFCLIRFSLLYSQDSWPVGPRQIQIEFSNAMTSNRTKLRNQIESARQDAKSIVVSAFEINDPKMTNAMRNGLLVVDGLHFE